MKFICASDLPPEVKNFIRLPFDLDPHYKREVGYPFTSESDQFQISPAASPEI